MFDSAANPKEKIHSVVARVGARWMNDETDDHSDVAALLEEIASGRHDAAETLMPLVYDRLRLLAQKLLGHESPGHTLQPTALVNEAYLRMVGQKQVDWQGKTHFFAIGAKMMRRILVDHARRKLSKKRGGGMHRIELADDGQPDQRDPGQTDHDIQSREHERQRDSKAGDEGERQRDDRL